MNRAHNDSTLGAALAALGRHVRRSEWAFSPIELLAHYTLPMVLILAIAAQLIAMTHRMAIDDVKQTVDGLKEDGTWAQLLEAWRQNFIRRIDLVCQDTEQEWRLNLFMHASRNGHGELCTRPSLTRVQWKGGWPGDADLQHLCTCAHALLDADRLTRELYGKVLTYRPVGGSPAEWPRLYDPTVFPRDPAPPELKELLKVTEEQRDFAFEHIRQRCLRWRELVVALQRELVDKVEQKHFQPKATGKLDADLACEVTDTAEQLKKRNYPLLPEAIRAWR